MTIADLGLPRVACPLFSRPDANKRYTVNGKQVLVCNFSSETREINAQDIEFTTDSTYLTGTNITYSGGRGSAAIKIVGTVSGLGGYHGVYSILTHSGAQVAAGYGAIGVKSIVTNTAAMSNGVIYGGMFIAKHASTSTMTAQASLIGLEGQAYISSSGPARTVIGINAVVHNECTGAYGAGSVIRVIQVVCDNNAAAEVPVESSAICIWNMAGAWDYGIKFVTSSTGFGIAILVDSATTALEITTCTTGITVTDATTAISVVACSVFANAAVTLASADNAMELIVTDSGVLATGTSRAVYIQVTNSGAKTASAYVEGLSIVMIATAAVTDLIGEKIHIHNATNNFTSNMVGLMIDLDDPGTGAQNVMLLDLYRDNTHVGATRDCYIRCKSGGTLLGKHVFYMEGSSNIMADALFGFLACGSTSFLKSGTCSGTIAYSIKVLVHSIAGDAGTAYYIPVYPTKD